MSRKIRRRWSDMVVKQLNPEDREQKDIEESLRISQERLSLALDAAHLATWDWDFVSGNLVWNDEHYRILGYEPGTIKPDYGVWVDRIHPEDRALVESQLRACMEHGGEYKAEYRMVALDGKVRWVEARGRFGCDAAGQAVRSHGVVMDITGRKRADEALRRSEEHFRVAQELSRDAFTILSAVRDESGVIVDFQWEYVNPEAGRILRHAPDELAGRRLLDVLPGNKTNSELFERYVRVVETGESHDIEIPYESEGIRGWFRNMTVKLGDGIAVYFADISKRKWAEMQLHCANERLLDADRRKSEFLAMAAHELRNPLNPVRVAAQLINSYCKRECLNHGRVVRQCEIVERHIGHMAHLIDDLLDVARITTGKIELRRQTIDLIDVLRHSIDSCSHQLGQKKQELIASLPDEPLWLDGDQTRLEQVFTNILGNASKYSPAERRIWVDVGMEHPRRDGMAAVVRVRDEGEGIKAELLPHIFELFTQGERGLDRAQGGLGVGLTMVQRLVEMHGGNVEADSDGPGQGSEFLVRLPVIEETGRGEAALNAPTIAHSGRSLRILAVDDLVTTAESIAELLELSGHFARVAFSGPAALLVAREWHPDVVLLDIGMPGMDGYEVARRLRVEHGRDMVLIALTGYGQESDRQEAQAARFDDYLVKPVDLNALREILARMV